MAFRRAATSALVAIGVWLALSLFGILLARLVAGFLDPQGSQATGAAALAHAGLEQQLASISPSTIFREVTTALLNPGATAVSVPDLAQAIQLNQQLPTILSLQQSLLSWPQLVLLVAITVALFVAAYIGFLRQEVRA